MSTTMTPAEVLELIDWHIEAITSLVGHNSPIGAEWPKARAAVAALVAERDALLDGPHHLPDATKMVCQPVALPDQTLCRFYGVDSWEALVAAQEEHVLKLQDAARRNVKPWEDTFPPTLLPKYLRDSGLAAAPEVPVALPDWITGTLVKIGDSPKGQPRLLIHTTREAIEAYGANLLFKRVRVSAETVALPDGWVAAKVVGFDCSARTLTLHFDSLPYVALAQTVMFSAAAPEVPRD